MYILGGLHLLKDRPVRHGDKDSLPGVLMCLEAW